MPGPPRHPTEASTRPKSSTPRKIGAKIIHHQTPGAGGPPVTKEGGPPDPRASTAVRAGATSKRRIEHRSRVCATVSSDERVDKATRLAGYELASIHPVRRCDVGQQCIPVATWASSIIPGARAVTSTQRKRCTHIRVAKHRRRTDAAHATPAVSTRSHPWLGPPRGVAGHIQPHSPGA